MKAVIKQKADKQVMMTDGYVTSYIYKNFKIEDNEAIMSGGAHSS
jgi:hypothetical protein